MNYLDDPETRAQRGYVSEEERWALWWFRFAALLAVAVIVAFTVWVVVR